MLHIRNIFKRHLLLHKYCKNGFAPSNKGSVRALDKKCLLMPFPPEPIVQIKNNFTEFYLIRSLPKLSKWFRSTEQMGHSELQIRNIFKSQLLLNHWSKFKLFPRIFPHDALYQNCTNDSAPTNKGAVKALDKKCILMAFQIQNNFTEMFLIMASTQNAQMVLLHQKRVSRALDKNIFKWNLLNHWFKIRNGPHVALYLNWLKGLAWLNNMATWAKYRNIF